MTSSSTTLDISTGSSAPFGRGLVETPLGMIHYKYTGSLPHQHDDDDNDDDTTSPLPILAFHMSPRSTDEYTEVMPLLSSSHSNHVGATDTAAATSSKRRRRRLVVALDEPGYGDSDNPNRSCTLDDIADAYLHVITHHLKIKDFVVTGSLMGCYIALSLASHYPQRVKGVIGTNLYYYPHEKHVQAVVQQQELEQQDQQIVDSWEMHEDGSHVMKLWKQRSSWLNAELNSRVVQDELTYLLKRRQRYAQPGCGIQIQNGAAFDLVTAASHVTCPVLLVMGGAAMRFFDTIGFDMTSQLELAKQLFPTMPQQVVIDAGAAGGSINLLNQNHVEWTDAVLQFLADHVETSCK